MASPAAILRTQRKQYKRKQKRENEKLKRKLFRNVFVYPCCYCKVVFLIDELTIEHKVPRSMGGTNDDENIDLACGPCNHQKGKESWILLRQLKRQQREQYSSQHC